MGQYTAVQHTNISQNISYISTETARQKHFRPAVKYETPEGPLTNLSAQLRTWWSNTAFQRGVILWCLASGASGVFQTGLTTIWSHVENIQSFIFIAEKCCSSALTQARLAA